MKILHLCLNGPFTDNWSYQDNLVSKYHAKQGHEVTIIATNMKHLDAGKIVETPCEDYINQDNVRVIRVAQRQSKIPRFNDFFSPYDVFNLICELKPDLIMVHGFIGSVSALQVKKYIRKVNPKCRAVLDIHQDYLNSPVKKTFKRCLIAFVHRILNNSMYPIYERIYYVAPSSNIFAKEYYRAPEAKLELLPLGCDPESIRLEKKKEIRNKFRKKHNIDSEDIVICHGGKMDELKRTKELVEAFSKLNKLFQNTKLVLFGSFRENYKNDIFPNGIPKNIIIEGMLSTKEYCDLYLACDIAVFVGSQSALWQPAIACGLGIVLKDLPHQKYLDLGGNAYFVKDYPTKYVYEGLLDIVKNNLYLKMSQVALEKGMDFFSYDEIAKKVVKDATQGKNGTK